MANKSDSAGKLHRYYTYRQCKEVFPNATGYSPLDFPIEKNAHEVLFTLFERVSLKRIGLLSCEVIIDNIGPDVELVTIDDIGISSGAGNVNVTDDLTITTSEGESIGFSLKCTQKIDNVLSKNMGAQSLLSGYFNSQELQNVFNEYYADAYLLFLNSCLDESESTTSIAQAKRLIKQKSTNAGNTKPRFSDDIFPNANSARNAFLTAIRGKLHECVGRLDTSNIIRACNLVLDVGKNHIRANYTVDREEVILEVIPEQINENFQSFRFVGDNSLEILLTRYKVGFRYKFESDICSSIKLIGSYQTIGN